MKKTLCLFLTLVLVAAIFVGCGNIDGTEDLQESPVGDFEYETNDENGITVLKYIGQSDTVVIPREIQNQPVTKIGDRAFEQTAVISVVIPDAVTVIGNECFYRCERLESVALSENLIQIGASAFQECTQLKRITIPSATQQIGDQAFNASGLEEVIFEEGIERIGGYGCFSQTHIKKLVLPSTVKEIGLSAFAACPNLEIVELNEGLVEIGHKAFVSNPSLKEIVIPSTVRVVTEMDFNMCSGLKKVMFEGNAPNTFEYSDEVSGVWEPYDLDFTVYYHEGAEGFTSPEWYGYPTKTW